jgi:hypothetical protein
MVSTVTICGADASVSPEDLVDLSVRFPFVEWCIDLNPDDRSLAWVEGLLRHAEQLRLLGNLHGSWKSDIFGRGSLSLRSEWPDLWNHLRRLRIDLISDKAIEKGTLLKALRLINKDVVLAVPSSDSPIAKFIKDQHLRVDILSLDPSEKGAFKIVDWSEENFTKEKDSPWVCLQGFKPKDGFAFDICMAEKCLDFAEDFVSANNWIGCFFETTAGQKRISSMLP